MTRPSGKGRQLFSHIRPKSAIAESFRTLRTNLTFSSCNWQNKVVLVTSPGPGDGKSTVSTNLGVVLAQAKSRVLLIECDLRKPVMQNYFDLDNRYGLTNLLAQDLKLEDVVCTTQVEGLDVIPSGPIPPNPSELLGSSRMSDLLEKTAAQYDVVLLDAPPVIAVTDAVLLVPMVDCVLLVLKSAETRIEMAREAKDRLVNAGAKSIGVVLNKAKMYGGGYSHYYHYYGRKEKSQQDNKAVAFQP